MKSSFSTRFHLSESSQIFEPALQQPHLAALISLLLPRVPQPSALQTLITEFLKKVFLWLP